MSCLSGAARKIPARSVGKKWHAKSSRHPKQTTAWFAGTDHDIALHCGRSGAVVFDADSPEKLPNVLRRHLDSAPFQSNVGRHDVAGRGHYIFTQPPGRALANGTGRLGGASGEIRGHNGVIIVAPSHHADGGRYQWESTADDVAGGHVDRGGGGAESVEVTDPAEDLARGQGTDATQVGQGATGGVGGGLNIAGGLDDSSVELAYLGDEVDGEAAQGFAGGQRRAKRRNAR